MFTAVNRGYEASELTFIARYNKEQMQIKNSVYKILRINKIFIMTKMFYSSTF